MSASPSIRQKGVCNHEGAMRSDFSSILELISGLSLDEAGQNHAELWKKMCFLIISMVEKTEQHPSTIKPATGSTTEKDIHSKKTTAKGRAQRPGGRLPRSHSDNEDEERDGRKKRKLSTDHDDAEIRKLRLKCPFYLRHPEKHRRGSCRGEGFADMGKLKDHLKRVHQKPRRCTKCWKEIPTEEDFRAHLKLDPPCPEHPEPDDDDRVSADTLQKLNFSRVPYANRSVEEKWKRLYSDLFPTEEDIPSPYEDYGLGPEFDKLLAQRLEKEFANEFTQGTERLDRESRYERLVEIIRECRKTKSRTGSLSHSGPESFMSHEAENGPLSDPRESRTPEL